MHMETTTNSFIKEETRGGSDEESSCVDHHLLLQVGARKQAQDDTDHGATRKHVVCDERKATSHDLKNFMDCGSSDLQSHDHHGPTGTTKIERSSPESESRSSSSAKRKQMDDQLIGSSKAELGQVMEENQRLKTYLDRILKDYRTLEMQYQDVVQQEHSTRPLLLAQRPNPEEPDELFALSLGRSSPSDRTKVDERKPPPSRNEHANRGEDREEGLTLGLDCKFRVPDDKKSTPEASPNRSFENSVDVEGKEEEGETWQPKTDKDTARENGDVDEITQQNPVKRARVSVRVRCDTPTMNDGCQWRKYGQKISKGNPCPRAYYRCTVAPSCPVRKQVQRCAEDMSILITTYEGTHSHPLPISATAMASTTSAAASMLLTGSSSSASGPGGSSAAPGSENLNGLNFYLSDNNNSRSKPFYLHNSSISSNPSFPTITLDLTSTSSSSTMSSHLSRLANNSIIIPPRQYSSTNLNFSSLESSTSNPLPISWSNGMLNYGSHQKNQTTSNSLSFGPQPYDQSTLYQSYLQKNTTSQQSVNPDTIAAATKAITSDPSFQSALAAALSSIIGGTNGKQKNEGETLSQLNHDMKTSEPPFPILSSFPSSSSSNTNKLCAPSFMNNKPSSTTTSSAHLQADGGMFLSPPFSNTKRRKSNSPGDNSRDHAA